MASEQPAILVRKCHCLGTFVLVLYIGEVSRDLPRSALKSPSEKENDGFALGRAYYACGLMGCNIFPNDA